MLILLFFSSQSTAIEKLSLDIGALNVQEWEFEGLQIALTDIPKHRQQLVLTIKKLSLPKPFEDLKLADIRCTSFTWGNNQMVCERGKARIDSKHWRSPKADFAFRLNEKSSMVKLTGLSLLGGRIDAELTEASMRWQVKLNAQHLDGLLLQKQFAANLFKVKSGDLSLAIKASGAQTTTDTIDLTATAEQLTLQTPDGKTATEALSSTAHWYAANQGGFWHWQHQSQLTGGALYLEPVYLEAASDPFSLSGRGSWNPVNRRVEIESFAYHHPKTAELTGSATAELGTTFNLVRAALVLQSEDMDRFSSVYLKPFTEQTSFEGISLQGKAKAEIDWAQQALTRLRLNFSQLAVNDQNGRIATKGGEGAIHWSSDPAFTVPSAIGWQELSLYALPLGPSKLSFLSRANKIDLIEKTQLPFLGGKIAVNKFSWQSQPQEEPNVYFEGSLNNVSLEQLSAALDWTPLSGTLSGRIPGIEYRDKTLKLGGELNIKVFDGTIKIANLASSGLFSDFPKLFADIEVEHLDLDLLTRKFEFGGITGRLSGFVKQLRLENWSPVSFYAWFGTPDDDDSRHRISQKAVRNIASIGGGGASDLLSRSFLSFFETFGYDKIGLGCYLHDGVCQMMGVEARETGYSIITGGGLPRIDVIGYNPQVDWSVLMERLQRITTSDEVIIK
ncbi:MAG: C4-dicarboxylate ABC transporter [Gammaproteobacteria bacterium]